MSDFERHLAQQMENSEFAAEYEALEAQYAFARQVIAARIRPASVRWNLPSV